MLHNLIVLIVLNLAFLFMLDLVLRNTLLLVVGLAFLLVVGLVHGLALLVGAVVVEFLGKMELAAQSVMSLRVVVEFLGQMELAAQSVMALSVVVKLACEELAGQTAAVVTTVTKTVAQAVVTLKGNSTGESSDSRNLINGVNECQDEIVRVLPRGETSL